MATGTLSMMVGLLINGVFRSIGVERGKDDEKMQKTREIYSSAVIEIVPEIDKLEKFCEEENKEALLRVRSRILAKAGIRYSDCFGDDGAQLPYETDLSSEEEIENAKEQKRRKMKRQNNQRARAYSKATSVKIKALTPQVLTSEGTKENDPFNFGKSKKEFYSRKNAGDLCSRILMAVIFGYFGVSFVSEVNFAALIWNALQIVMYITSGVMQMYSSYNFIVDDYRASLIKKIDYLQKFKLWAERQPR